MTTPFPTLFRLAQSRGSGGLLECCDLCSEPLASPHRHLLEVDPRAVHCACQACAILFSKGAASQGKYRLIPDRRLYLEDFHMTDAQWQCLRIPVGLTFVCISSATNAAVAQYPSPMGAVESELDQTIWQQWSERAELRDMVPDVEAFLVNRARTAREYFVVPIDDCYRLVALVQRNWKGLAGGQGVWKEIGAFFDRLKAQARVIGRSTVSGISPAAF